ncbi:MULTISPECIES: DUF4178 domain-containing protein [Cohnella]|jgi:hypothetical protein|uniref:DUF4178 domain-containing protein n=1 Tax=Cohnella TaxID=329857 RepID=UPI00035D65C7|nr:MULTISPECIES: DUF4178 domain-containing protein [Cohnella]REK66554.1 MAG: DUF4178 domain-containing protein [Cohnella sp.]
MSLLKRVKNLLRKPEPLKAEKSVMTLGPGDVCEVSLVTYQVVGRTKPLSRNSVWLTLRDGASIRYLSVEERATRQFGLYSVIDGRLDSVDEVPTEIELDGIHYFLEERYSTRISATGNTPFAETGGELYVWQYQSDNRKLLRIEWQDGRFMLYEGESVLPADVEWLRGNA